MLVSDYEKLSNPLTIAYPRCEVAETLQGGYCERSGKSDSRGWFSVSDTPGCLRPKIAGPSWRGSFLPWTCV